jgi:hypothetical protein
MIKKVIIVVCTLSKTVDDFKNRPVYKTLEKLHKLYSASEFDVRIIKDNKKGLSEVYNSFLSEEYKKNIIVFMHDDIEINDLFLVEKLNESPHVITGLAGSKSLDLSKDKIAWHLCCERQDMMGEVSHKKDNFVWTSVFGPTNGRVLIIDGLFISVNVEELLKTEAKFNEKFKFHHYDIAFCLNCNKHKVKVGVLPINVVHYGLGDSMMTQEWEDSNSLFKKEYNS